MFLVRGPGPIGEGRPDIEGGVWRKAAGGATPGGRGAPMANQKRRTLVPGCQPTEGRVRTGPLKMPAGSADAAGRALFESIGDEGDLNSRGPFRRAAH